MIRKEVEEEWWVSTKKETKKAGGGGIFLNQHERFDNGMETVL